LDDVASGVESLVSGLTAMSIGTRSTESVYEDLQATPIWRASPHETGKSEANLHSNTYYVTEQDGAHLRALLAELGDAFATREYKKGMLVRRGSDEWYFEYRNYWL
jgi:hypothetical protein